MSRIFVTGSAQGIGAETSRQLIELGHEVVVHGRTDERTAAAKDANPGAFAAITGDLGDIASTTARARQANQHGPYDAIIHNAGIGAGSGPRFELAARHPDLIVNCVDPGWIKTQLGGPNAWDSVDEGAETQVWLVTSGDPVATASGRYLKRREVLEPNPETGNAELRARLVVALEAITGLQLP